MLESYIQQMDVRRDFYMIIKSISVYIKVGVKRSLNRKPGEDEGEADLPWPRVSVAPP